MSIGYIASGGIGNRVAAISSCIYDSQYKNINLTENMIHLMKENKKNCYSENSLCKTCHNAKKWPVETVYETFS